MTRYLHKTLAVAYVLAMAASGCTDTAPAKNFVFPAERAVDTITPASFKNRSTGYLVYDPAEHVVLASHNAHTAFIPASVSKLAVVSAAITILGADTTFRTELLRGGAVKDGVLQGDLWLKGYGDPLLSTKSLLAFVDSLESRGIKQISGSFMYDTTWYSNAEFVERSLGEVSSYNPGYGALSMNYNLVHAHWERQSWSAEAEHFLVPPVPYMELQLPARHRQGWVQFQHIEQGDRIIYRQTQAHQLRGNTALPVRNPGRYAAETLRHLCSIRGITLPGAVPGEAPTSARVLHSHTSRTVEQIAAMALDFSNNMLTETLMLAIGRKIFERAASVEETAQYLTETFFPEQMPNIDWEGFVLVNGSGLTSANRITPSQAVALLVLADAVHREGALYQALPCSGSHGTIRNKYNSPETVHRIQAKTGAIFYAQGLAGRFFGQNGKPYLFAMFVTDHERRTLLDEGRPGEELSRATAGAGTWLRQQDEIFATVLEQWIQNAGN